MTTSRASAAEEVMAKLKTAIDEQGANSLRNLVPMEKFEQFQGRFNILDRELRAEDPVPPPDDSRWIRKS